ncbi:MAG: hypothetical protein IJY09_07340 [Lachnospiraceae bacterium]|nr:hypothetical protein [Lachnospiraceae bacterium]
MKNKIKRYQRLAALLFSDSRKLFVIAGGVLVLALSFILFFASLNSTIVRSQRQQTIDTHGSFLGVFSDIEESLANTIMEAETEFCYEIFQVQDELDYEGESVSIGWVTEAVGKSMGIFLKSGVWVQEKDEILVEEYLAAEWGITVLPQKVSLQKDGQAIEYTVCGIVGNYSGNLPVANWDANGRKEYPSVITACRKTAQPVSLIVLQKQLRVETAEDDIFEVMSLYGKYEIAPEKVSLNQYLDECYTNTKDFEVVSTLYTVAVLILLLLVELVILRAILIKSRQAKRCLAELGLQRKDFWGACGWQVGMLLLRVWLTQMLLGILFGKIGGYVTGYGELLEQQVFVTLLKELVLLGFFLMIFFLLGWDDKSEKKEEKQEKEKSYRYLFRRFNVPLFGIQSLLLIFVLFSVCMREKFAVAEEGMRVRILAQSMYSYEEIEGYAFSEKAVGCYDKESIWRFEEKWDVLDMYMIGELQFASLLIDEEHMTPYFQKLLELNEERKLEADTEAGYELPEEAKQYETLLYDSFEVIVLPDLLFQKFLEKNALVWKRNSNEALECVMVFPVPGAREVMRQAENPIITVGKIALQENQLRFAKEEFHVIGQLENAIGLEDFIMNKHLAVMVLPVSEAEKSKMILGYRQIVFKMTESMTRAEQEELDNKIAMLAASKQGGGTYSTFEEQKEDALYRHYAAFMGSTMLVFGILVMGAFVFVHYYVNWEQNKYAYGVFRSMGMPYHTLQGKLFAQYITGLLPAWYIACFVVKESFGYDIRIGQVLLSGSILVLLICGCYALLYHEYRKWRICDMLQRG